MTDALWSSARIGDLVERAVETIDVAHRDQFERFIGVDHLDSDDLELRRWGNVSSDQLPPTFRYVFRAGMVLFPTRRPALRKCVRTRFDGLTGEKLLVLISRNPQRLHTALLPHVLASPLVKRWVAERAIGSVTPHFRWSDLAECTVPLPPLRDQFAFAQILDRALQLNDDLGTARGLGEAVLAGLLENHFTTHVKSEVSVLDRAQAQSGGTPARGNPKYWSGTVPWLSPKDMKQYVVTETSEHITHDAINAGHSLAPAGTTFIVVRGMILQHSFPVCRSTVPMAFNQDVKALLPNDGLDPAYLSLWFRWAAPRFLRLVSETSHGTKRLESDRLKTMPFSDASLAAQQAFVLEFDAVNDVLMAIDARRKVLDHVHKSVLAEMKLT